MNNTDEQLKKMQYSFDASFEELVMESIEPAKVIHLPSYKWLVSGIAASIAVCLGLIYFQDGSINYDTLLGVDQLSFSSSTDIFEYL